MVTISDKLMKASSGTRPNPTTLTAVKGIGDSILNADDLTGWALDTPITFVLFKIDTSGDEILGTRSDWKGIVSGNTITQLVLTAGVDTIYPSGSPVIAAATARWADDLVGALLVSHNQNGTLKDGTVADTVLADNAVTSAKAAAGFAVQMVSSNVSAVATGTTVMVRDDTIPQITEGNEYMTLAITPKSATNILRIEALVYCTSSVANNMIVALFQDANANALAVEEINISAGTAVTTIALSYTMTAGTVGSTTFRIRAGGSVAGTTTFNGSSAARLYGTTPKSSIVITEYKA